MVTTASQPTKAAVLTAATMICFAANSLLCRLALGPGLIDPASFTTVRVLAAVVILALVVWQRYGHLPSFAYAKVRSVAALFVYLICFSFAYVRLTAGTGALILFTAVQLTMFCVALREGERFSAAGWIGLSIASLGLICLVLPGVSAPDPLGAILIAVSGIAWGVFSLSARGVDHPIEANAINFLCCLPLAAAVNLWELSDVHVTSTGLAYAIASGAVASGLGYVMWYVTLRHLSAARAASVQLSVPAIAAIGGALFLAEPVTLRLLLASPAMLGGIALVLAQRSKR
ncbi:DMT family transporter [Bradyrhizobium symbiodeficiens]|uniref:DMT family transporter n=1 Tax=Bradyrhizobium symbiodeficiens TaxID=1404367 RepID=A0ABX5WG99_9BRAD|nr:DMT family transporter [Bradyrhizobium symbiodeficiens]